MNEPRTIIQIMSDLLARVIDAEWSGSVTYGCRFDQNEVAACPECLIIKYENERIKQKSEPGIHLPDCKLKMLIEETKALLRAENELLEAKGDFDLMVWFKD